MAKDQAHYDAIVAVMRLRENLRSYVTDINAETAATGMPMIRPMFLQFPNDSVCQTRAVEDQFMFGPDWLVVGDAADVDGQGRLLPFFFLQIKDGDNLFDFLLCHGK